MFKAKFEKNLLRLVLISTIAILLISMIGAISAATYTIDSKKSSNEINSFFNDVNSPLKNGDNVIFKSGTYNNLNLSINKSINLKGDGKVNLHGLPSHTVIMLRSSNSHISGISIKSSYIGIHISGNNNRVTDSNIKVSSSYYGAISIGRDSKNNKITGNSLENTGECGSGVFLDYQSANNQIRNNSITTKFVGIQATGSSNNDISKNNIKGHSGIAVNGISSQNKVYDNVIKVTGFNGITKYLYGNPAITVNGEGIMLSGYRLYANEYFSTENRIYQNSIDSLHSKAISLNLYSRKNTINNNLVLKGTITNSGSGNVLSNNNKNVKLATNNALADLTISKVTKKSNTHTVFIRNIGKVSAGKSVLGVYDGNKLIKKANVKEIGVGKTVQVKVTLAKKFSSKIKTFRADYNNKIKESNKNNNIKRAK